MMFYLILGYHLNPHKSGRNTYDEDDDYDDRRRKSIRRKHQQANYKSDVKVEKTEKLYKTPLYEKF